MSDYDWSDVESDTPQAATPNDISTLATTPRRSAGRLGDACVPWSLVTQPLLDDLEKVAEAPGTLGGLPTGFTELDDMLHGLQKGRLYLVGALTGAGKSVFLGDLFRTWMTLQIPCCMISLEMGREEIAKRQAAAACRIDHGRLQSGDLADDDWTKLARWVGATDNAPAWICDKTAATIGDLSDLVQWGVAEHGWQAVIIDYAQKILAPGLTREQAVASIAVGLKTIAREADIPVIIGAQLNRESTKRPGGEPKLSDLRESAALEHEIDVGILIHRPDYDDPKSARVGEADLLVKKNRGGARGTVTVAAQLQWQRFVPLDASNSTPCIACYQPHGGAMGTKCVRCSGGPR
jgi:replicative DNA helicase